MDSLPTTVQDGATQQEQQGKTTPPGLAPEKFMAYCRDIQIQPAWRHEADKAVDYYDGNQLDQDTMSALQQKGMGPLIANIIAPILNVALGMEAKTRSDARCEADSDDWQDVAEAFSAKLMESKRQAHTDRACSDAYAGQIKAGLGWVEAWRNSNPFQYQYRTNFVHRRELFWDWRDQSYDLNKARYQVRKRWFDVDEAIAYFPQKKDALEACVGDTLRYYLETMHSDMTLVNAFDQLRGLDMADYENWRSIERRRLCLYECWYRTYCRGYVLRLADNDVLECDTKNPVHVAMIAQGLAKPELAVYTKMNLSIWAGPIKLLDTPVKNDYSPYVPFWGYREDRTGVPYGLIRAMISPQDEVNARRQKLLWLLGAKRVTMDADALDEESNDITTMSQEISRPDAVIVLNPNRINRQGAFEVDHNLELSDGQFKVMKDSEDAAQRVVGVFNSLLGRDSSTTSGIAINSLVEQGMTTLAEINDNYRFARRLVFQHMVDMIRDDMMGQEVTVVAGEQGKRKTITLNQRAVHQPTGMQIVLNNVNAAKVKVALEDVPSTPAYRSQQLTMLTEVVKGLPPQLQAAIAPFYMEATDLQKRREMAQSLRKALGQQEPQTPEEEQAMQAQAQEQQDMARQSAILDLRLRDAKVRLMEAQAAKFMADARAEGVDGTEAAQMEIELKNALDDAKRQVDNVTAQMLSERQHSRLREQALRNRLDSTRNAGQPENGANHVANLKQHLDALTQQFSDHLATVGAKAKKSKTTTEAK